MANLKPRLLTDSELRRHEDCAAENAKLAGCWGSAQVIILAIDWTRAYKSSPYDFLPTLRLNIMSPAEKPVWGGSAVGDKQPARQHCRRTIRMLERTKVNKQIRPRPFYTNSDGYDGYERFDMYSDDAIKKAQEIFNELATEYAVMCIVSHDVRDSMRALEAFEVKLPAKKAVFVDLIKVLEHQTRDDGIPEELSEYADEYIAVRNGRYDAKTGAVGGLAELPYIQILEVVGPAAESHRRDFRKAEREDAALKRIVGRMKKG